MTYEPPAVYGIIGKPVAHSLSPLMHNAAFKALDVNAVYKLFPLEDETELKLFFEDLKEKDNPIFGINVTLPYKEKVLPYLDAVDPFAEKVGAVNTVVIDHNRKMFGFNTDGPGFLAHIQELGFDPGNKRIAILGAGGTTRSILTVLLLISPRPEKIYLYNRTRSKAEALIADIASKMDTSLVEIVDDVEDLNIELADILVNTTTVGMKPSDPLLIPIEQIHKDMLVYDVIYAPAETLLLAKAKAKGANVANGLGMLFYQGVLAFQHWADVELDEKTKKIMRNALKN